MKNGSKLEKILWERGERLKELEDSLIKNGTKLSYPTLVSIHKGRIKKYHDSTLSVLCSHLSTPDKTLTKDDILGLVDDTKTAHDVANLASKIGGAGVEKSLNDIEEPDNNNAPT